MKVVASPISKRHLNLTMEPTSMLECLVYERRIELFAIVQQMAVLFLQLFKILKCDYLS